VAGRGLLRALLGDSPVVESTLVASSSSDCGRTAPGILKSALEKVFEAFRRV
jgi:hypothetical protein